jgi:hypothetical protein
MLKIETFKKKGLMGGAHLVGRIIQGEIGTLFSLGSGGFSGSLKFFIFYLWVK